MNGESSTQAVASWYEAQVACVPEGRGSGQACPMCGGGLVPLRGAWRCSRCYFALCVGCEMGLETADTCD
jgi:hypothetical protein